MTTPVTPIAGSASVVTTGGNAVVAVPDRKSVV